MTTNDDKTERSGKTPPAMKRLRRWLFHIVIALAVLIGGYILFRILYPVWIDSRLPADAPRIAFSLDNSLLGRIGVTDATYQRVMTAAGGRLITLRPDAAGDPVNPKAVEALLRDDFEIALIRAARQRGLPMLGICRGCQILNVALGGTVRNLRKEPELKRQHLVLKGHPVDLAPDSKLAAIFGVTHLAKVISLHGNAVGKPAPDVRIAAIGPGSVIEAIEADSAGNEGWIIGIQWHPELTLDTKVQHKVFKIFVDRARKKRLNVTSSETETSVP
jgi:gamma-glutamyl-gamma-aminobutyrate hydrolase PuuD